MPPSYDSKEEMLAYLDDLKGLTALVRERRQAGYDREERLQEWIVLGRLCFDVCGNVAMLTSEGHPAPKSLPKVMTKFEFQTYLIPDWSYTSEFGVCLPDDDAICFLCNKGWNMNNWWSAMRDLKNRIVHKECHRLSAEDENRVFFEKALKEAGYGNSALQSIPNEYHSHCECCYPWFLVPVANGVLKMGWRKRVINLDWSRLALKKQPDFAKEDTTKSGSSIHAWGEKKLIEYLKEIKSCS